jgi:hypothetical protein
MIQNTPAAEALQEAKRPERRKSRLVFLREGLLPSPFRSIGQITGTTQSTPGVATELYIKMRDKDKLEVT